MGNTAGLPTQGIVGQRLADGGGQAANGSPNLTNIVSVLMLVRFCWPFASRSKPSRWTAIPYVNVFICLLVL